MTQVQVDMLDDRDMAFGIVMDDDLLFPLLFWDEDLTIPEERTDLGDLAGKQLITVPQKMLLLDQSERLIVHTGRKTIKTVNLEVKAIKWPLWNRRKVGEDEAMITTPGQTHLDQLMNRVYARIRGTPLFSLFCPDNNMTKGAGETVWLTNMHVYWRIEGISGTDRNMAGVRAKWILGDEMAFGNDICHGSRVQTALPGAKWIYSGVPNFMNSPFRRIATSKEGGKDWSDHTGSTYDYNPLYGSAKARRDLINSYESVSDPLYLTQVLGLWTDRMGASAFPPGCFNLHSKSFFLSNPSTEDIENQEWTKILKGFNANYKSYLIGYDYGYSPDPSVIIVFGTNDDSAWYMTARFKLEAVKQPDQIAFIKKLCETSLRRQVALISTDNVQAKQLIESSIPWLRQSLLGNELVTWSVPQGTTERIDTDGEPTLTPKGKPVTVRNKEFQTELLRESMTYATLNAPYYFSFALPKGDDDTLDELAGTSAVRTNAGYLTFHSPKKTIGSKSDDDHITDALRFSADAAYKLWLYGISTTEEHSVAGLGVITTGVMPGQTPDDPSEFSNPALYPARDSGYY